MNSGILQDGYAGVYFQEKEFDCQGRILSKITVGAVDWAIK